MSALGMIYLFITPFLLKRYAAKWTYYAWLIVIIGLIIPFRPEMNMSLIEVTLPFANGDEALLTEEARNDNTLSSMNEQQMMQPNADKQEESFQAVSFEEGRATDSSLDLASDLNTQVVTQNETASELADGSVASVYTEEQGKLFTSNVLWSYMIFAIWLTGVMAYFMYQIHTYYRFKKTLYRWSDDILDTNIKYTFENIKKTMDIKTNVSLKQSYVIDTPMLIGMTKSTIVLPHRNYNSHELRFVLTHELVHYKRKDMWVKALTMVATAMHWFNPLLYVISKAISSQCEISCDEAVVKRIDQNGRREYGEMILKTARDQHRKIQTTLTTNFYGGKREMKKRLVSIMNVKKKKAGVVIASSMLLVTSLTGGIFAVAEVTKPAILGETAYTNEANEGILANAQQNVNQDPIVFINGKESAFEHAAFYVGEEVYIPFIEMLQTVGGTIEWNGDKAFAYTYDDMTVNIVIGEENVTLTDFKGAAVPILIPMQSKEDEIYVPIDQLVMIENGGGLKHSNPITHHSYFMTEEVPLAEALKSNDNNKVKQLLADGADVTVRSGMGDTLLQLAIARNNVDNVKLLLDAGADPNTLISNWEEPEPVTPLDYAVKRGNKEIAQLILAKNPAIEEQDQLFYEAVEAILTNNSSSLQQTIQKGLKMNEQNKAGLTLLTTAVNWDNAALKVVLDAGADVDAKNAEGKTALMYAALNSNVDAVKLLIEKDANLDLQNEYQNTALMFSLYFTGNDEFTAEKVDTALALIEAGADVNIQADDKVTALLKLMREWGSGWNENAEKVFFALINANADVNLKDRLGKTALHHAPSVAVAKALVDAGANLDEKDDEGSSPLAVVRDMDIMTYLIQQGANKEGLNDALHNAAFGFDGEQAFVTFLLEQGADVNSQTEYGDTALHRAVVNLGRNLLEDEEEFLKNFNMVKFLLDKGADVNKQNEDGETPLKEILNSPIYENDPQEQKRQTEVVNMLLNKGADVKLKNKYGNTVLMAASNGDVAKLLIEAGAEVNASNSYGLTALMAAAESANAEVVKVLLDADADVTAKKDANADYNEPEKTALDLAKEGQQMNRNKNYDETIKLLEEAMKE